MARTPTVRQEQVGPSQPAGTFKPPRQINRRVGLNLSRRQGQVSILANEVGQPCETDSKMLSDKIGAIMSSGDPIRLDILDWRHVCTKDKETVITMLESEFEFVNPLTKGWLMEKFGKLWRGAKYRVKRDYHVDTIPLDLQYQYGPSYLDLTQWKNLVDHWRKSETMAKAKKNHDNRILKKVNHRAGRKAFARIEHDEAMKNGGIKPDKMTMFMILHKPKGTKPMDSPTKKLVEAMEVHLTQIPEGTVVQMLEIKHSKQWLVREGMVALL